MNKLLRILTNHYRSIIFVLMWIFLTFLWFIGPENDPELTYFDVMLFFSILLGLFFVFIEILKEIPKTIRKIIEKFGKDSGDDRSFLEKFSEIIFHSVASTLLFFVLATAVMTAIAACRAPFPVIIRQRFYRKHHVGWPFDLFSDRDPLSFVQISGYSDILDCNSNNSYFRNSLSCCPCWHYRDFVSRRSSFMGGFLFNNAAENRNNDNRK